MSYCDMSGQVFLTGVMMPGPDSKNEVINSFQINGRNPLLISRSRLRYQQSGFTHSGIKRLLALRRSAVIIIIIINVTGVPT